MTVKSYRRYCELMELVEKAERDRRSADVIFINRQILREVFAGRLKADELSSADITEIMSAVKAVHYFMQNVIMPKWLELCPSVTEPEENEGSIFDDLDREDGYCDIDGEDSRSIWEVCRSNTDRIVKMAVRAFGSPLPAVLDMDIIALLDYVKFEIETREEG